MTPTSAPPTARRWLLPSLAAAGVLVVAGLAMFQPWKLWIDETVNEVAPVAAAAVTAAPGTTSAPPATTAPPATASPALEPSTTVSPTAPPAPEPSTAVSPTAPAPTAPPIPAPPAATPAPTAPPIPAPPAATPAPSRAPAPPAEPAPSEFRSKAHGTSGTVRLLTLEDGSRVLRIEDLDTDNGPDVKVVLSTDPEGYVGAGAVNLGTLKGNRGSQNYEIPAEVDLTTLRSVVLWCKRFDVDFGVAALPGS